MNVTDLFQSLSLGELSNLSLSDGGSGTIIEAQQPKVIRHANEALLRLYGRFVLKEDDVLVQMYEHITIYELKRKFAETYVPPAGVAKQKWLYIKDLHTEKPFQDDVIRILKVFNSYGHEMPLNNEDERWSLFTPRTKTLQVPIPLRRQALSVSYQARHNRLSVDQLDAEIELPEILEGALTSYIASNVFTDMGGPENIQRGQVLMSKYEAICVEVEEKDVIGVTNSSSASVFEQRGFI
jgi:hypothetical protein